MPEGESRSGTVLGGRYTIDRLIARGGMASVYLAHQAGLERVVAVKVLSPPPDAEGDVQFEHRFRLEAATLASLDHPNIVIVHDFGETADGRYFIAMEYVDGLRLTDLLREGPLPVERAVRLILQVCAALRYAHKKGVVHRDLKPSNLLIRETEDGGDQVKVVDFGLVKLAEQDQSLTRAGLILGSPHCMAPEQIKGGDVDHRADVYGIGVVLYRSVVGKYPFHGENSTATMVGHLNTPVPSFAEAAPDVVFPAGLEAIVRRCLAKDPADRYDDVRELASDLAACLDLADVSRGGSQSVSIVSARHRAPIVAASARSPARGVSTALVGVTLLGAAVLTALTAAGAALVWSLGWATPDGEGTPAPAPDLVTVPAPPGPVVVADPPPPAPVPTPSPEVAPTGTATSDDPAPAPRPRPRPAPAADVAPAPAPVAPAPTPAPAPVPEDDAPSGYLGLPDDL